MARFGEGRRLICFCTFLLASFFSYTTVSFSWLIVTTHYVNDVITHTAFGFQASVHHKVAKSRLNSASCHALELQSSFPLGVELEQVGPDLVCNVPFSDSIMERLDLAAHWLLDDAGRGSLLHHCRQCHVEL